MHTAVNTSLEVLLLKAGSGTKWSVAIPASITYAPFLYLQSDKYHSFYSTDVAMEYH